MLGTFYRIIVDSAGTENYPIREQLEGAARFLCESIALNKQAGCDESR